MGAIVFDTHKFVKKLKTGGGMRASFEQKQAEALVRSRHASPPSRNQGQVFGISSTVGWNGYSVPLLFH